MQEYTITDEEWNKALKIVDGKNSFINELSAKIQDLRKSEDALKEENEKFIIENKTLRSENTVLKGQLEQSTKQYFELKQTTSLLLSTLNETMDSITKQKLKAKGTYMEQMEHAMKVKTAEDLIKGYDGKILESC